jgi:hypothetical protein
MKGTGTKVAALLSNYQIDELSHLHLLLPFLQFLFLTYYLGKVVLL